MESQVERESIAISKMNKESSKVKTPKNVRQIGKIGEGLRIYVEDYVKTYTKQLVESDYSSRCIAVLVGEYHSNDQDRNVFLYGAIKVECDCQDEDNIFTEEVWTVIYEKIKAYFPDAEIVGWYYGGTGLETEELPLLEKIQGNNFAGRDKVLLTYDVLEKESNFYLFDGCSMVLQPGYYIYYEKNEEMQNYMVDHKKIKQEEEKVDDYAVREIRTVMNEKKVIQTPIKEQKMVFRLSYVAGTLMLVVALIVGITIFNSGQRMEEIEGDLQVMKNNIFEKEAENSESKVLNEKKEDLFDKLIAEATDKSNQPSNSVSPTSFPERVTPEANPTTEVTQQEKTESPVSNVISDSFVEYIVKEGDTLASICKRECGSYHAISKVKELNQILDENVILVGQILLLPQK